MKKTVLKTLLLLTVLSAGTARSATNVWVDTFTLYVTKEARPAVSTNTLTITVTEGGTASTTLTLTNSGNVAVGYSLNTDFDTIYAGYTQSIKDDVSGWHSFPPQFDVPDTDTTFTNWVDQTTAANPIGFSFPLYFDGNQTYDTFSVGIHGGMILGSGSLTNNEHGAFEYYHSFFDNPIPNRSFYGDFLISTDPLVAPFWSELSIETDNVRFYTNETDRLIVSWEGATHDVTGGTDGLKFQAHLQADGTIAFLYQNLNGTVVSNAAAGIQKAAPNNPQTSPENYYMETLLKNDIYTVTLSPNLQQWITASSTSGNLGGAEGQPITFNVDASNRAAGTNPYTVDVVWADGTTNTVALTVIVQAATPVLNVQPTSINFSGPAGDITVTNVTLSNTGSGTLNYSTFSAGAQSAGYDAYRDPMHPGEEGFIPLPGTALPSDINQYASIFAWDDELQELNEKQIEVRAVADGSSELGENEVGLIPSGQMLPAWGDTPVLLASEGYTPLLPIGFEFPYYGAYYTNLSIGVNGGISLGSARPMAKAERWENFDPRPNTLWQNRQYAWVWYSFLTTNTSDPKTDQSTIKKFPQTANMGWFLNNSYDYQEYCFTPASVRANPVPDQFLAPYWSDLVMNENSRIYITQHENRTVITWENMLDAYADGGGAAQTFQIVLYKDGTFLFQYDYCDGVDFKHQPTLSVDYGDEWQNTYDLAFGVDIGFIDTPSRISDLEVNFTSVTTNTVTVTNGYVLLSNGMESDVPNLETVEVYETNTVDTLDDVAFIFTPKLSDPRIYLDGSAFGSLEPGESRVIMVVGDARNSDTNQSTSSTFTFNSNGGNKNLPVTFTTTDPFAPGELKDSDHDGQSDAAERMAGTDVNDAESVFKTNVDGSRTLSWPAPAGAYADYDREYTIEYTTSLTAGWQGLATVTNVTEFTDILNADEPQIFYRVTVTVLNP